MDTLEEADSSVEQNAHLAVQVADVPKTCCPSVSALLCPSTFSGSNGEHWGDAPLLSLGYNAEIKISSSVVSICLLELK